MTALIAAVLILGAGKPEPVAGDTFEKTNKPSGLMPAHHAVTVAEKGRIDFVPVAAWEKLFAVEPRTAKDCVTVPIAALKKALAAKAAPPADKELLLAGCPDASAGFTLHVRRVKFKGGQGLLYVTQFFIENVLTSNAGLDAMFQGLSDDGKMWVGGAVPLRAKGLRDDGGDLQKDPAAYKKQIAADAAMLAKLQPGDFTPSLDALAAELATLELP